MLVTTWPLLRQRFLFPFCFLPWLRDAAVGIFELPWGRIPQLPVWKKPGASCWQKWSRAAPLQTKLLLNALSWGEEGTEWLQPSSFTCHTRCAVPGHGEEVNAGQAVGSLSAAGTAPAFLRWCNLVSHTGNGYFQHFGFLFVPVGWWGLKVWYLAVIHFFPPLCWHSVC